MRGRLIAAALASSALAFAAAPKGKPVEPGKPGGPPVVDLAAAWAIPFPASRAPVAAETLDPAEAARILAAPPLTLDAKEQLGWIEEIEGRKGEAKLLAAEKPAVTRAGARLLLTPASGPELLFQNHRVPATKDADGDGTSYLYRGRLGSGRLHRVQASFEHDSPGSYLVSPEDGKVLFVHEGSDLAVLAPGEERLALMNDLDMPLTLAVVSLAKDGPALELVCRAGDVRTGGELTGWRGPGAVELVLTPLEGTTRLRLPVRVERRGNGWTLASSARERLAAKDGLACADAKGAPTR